MNAAILCHSKCASQWFTSNLIKLTLNQPKEGVDTHGQNPPWLYPRIKSIFDSGRGLFISMNTSRHDIEAMESIAIDFRGVHLVRDPRDMLVSAYFSHKFSHPTSHWPELVEFRKRLHVISMEAGLLAEIDFMSVAFDALSAWKHHPSVLELKVEEVTLAEIEYTTKICKWLQWDVTDQAIDFVVQSGSFEKRSGRSKGTEDQKSHYRKGMAGDWKNHFTPAVKEAFYARYANLLPKWGYDL